MSYYSNPSPYTNSYNNSYQNNQQYDNNSYNQNSNNNSYQNNQQYNNNDEDEEEEDGEQYDEDEEQEEEQYDEDEEDQEEQEEEQYDEEEEDQEEQYDEEEDQEEQYDEEEDDEDDEETYDRRTWDMGHSSLGTINSFRGHAKHDEEEEFYCKTCGEVHYNGDECPDNKPNNESDFEICAICRDELNNGRMDAKCLCCNAWFHKSCIKKSRKHSYECPCCKGDWEYDYDNDWLEEQCRNGPIFKSL